MSPAGLPLFREAVKDRVGNGDLRPDIEKAYTANFKLFDKFFDFKAPPESPLSENVLGIDKTRRTSQDHLPLTSKRALDYFRIKHINPCSPTPLDPSNLPISAACLQSAALALALDATIGFVPLSLSHHFLPDVAACSSLDFALRFHTDVLDMEKWHLRELHTVVGDYGRTFNEARVWDEGRRLVATMNQQNLLRPHKGHDTSRMGETKL